jgi:hypothetical protein
MKLRIIFALSTAALIAASPVASAQGVSSDAPGHNKVDGTRGATSSAPGQKMLNDRKNNVDTPGPGASHYAPGSPTTGSGIKTDRDDTAKTKSKY